MKKYIKPTIDHEEQHKIVYNPEYYTVEEFGKAFNVNIYSLQTFNLDELELLAPETGFTYQELFETLYNLRDLDRYKFKIEKGK